MRSPNSSRFKRSSILTLCLCKMVGGCGVKQSPSPWLPGVESRFDHKTTEPPKDLSVTKAKEKSLEKSSPIPMETPTQIK
jgi:hypothetical protein